jgi:Vacuolar 14 Fab1-binding region
MQRLPDVRCRSSTLSTHSEAACAQDYALSPQANQRKGGLLCLAAAAVGLGDAGSAHLQSIVPPVLDSFTDQDSRVRYYACEVPCAALLQCTPSAASASGV